VKRYFAVALGILTAIGGFVDMGDLVTNAVVGSRFGLSLAWVVVLGVIGITLYAHMAGKVTALSGRATFEVIRERLGPRAAVANLSASFLMTLLTLTAEIGGIAVSLQLLTGIVPLGLIVVAILVVWLIIWLVKFTVMENIFGLAGLTLIVFIVALFSLGPDWSELGDQVLQQAPNPNEDRLTYFYFAIALFGAAMTPYEVFFFSSGAAEERWGSRDLFLSRLNAGVGFPLGGLLSLGIAGSAFLVMSPAGVEVSSLSEVVMPVGIALGTVGLLLAVFGVLAATMGAALETALSCGYALSQYAGWPWGKHRRPAHAPQFHLTIIVCLLIACGVLATGVDPILVTEFSVVFSAVGLPLTYGPILIVANDPQYVGEHTNSRTLNAIGVVYLFIILAAALAAIPLMILTGMGS
jgi:manganese transport protein